MLGPLEPNNPQQSSQPGVSAQGEKALHEVHTTQAIQLQISAAIPTQIEVAAISLNRFVELVKALGSPLQQEFLEHTWEVAQTPREDLNRNFLSYQVTPGRFSATVIDSLSASSVDPLSFQGQGVCLEGLFPDLPRVKIFFGQEGGDSKVPKNGPMSLRFEIDDPARIPQVENWRQLGEVADLLGIKLETMAKRVFYDGEEEQYYNAAVPGIRAAFKVYEGYKGGDDLLAMSGRGEVPPLIVARPGESLEAFLDYLESFWEGANARPLAVKFGGVTVEVLPQQSFDEFAGDLSSILARNTIDVKNALPVDVRILTSNSGVVCKALANLGIEINPKDLRLLFDAIEGERELDRDTLQALRISNTALTFRVERSFRRYEKSAGLEPEDVPAFDSGSGWQEKSDTTVVDSRAVRVQLAFKGNDEKVYGVVFQLAEGARENIDTVLTTIDLSNSIYERGLDHQGSWELVRKVVGGLDIAAIPKRLVGVIEETAQGFPLAVLAKDKFSWRVAVSVQTGM